jgi:hypothetical protein
MGIRGSCHCGRIAFEIDGEVPPQLTRCTCTFCSKRGALLAYYTPAQFRLTQAEALGTYRWNTRMVAHHFCSECGIATHSDSPAFEHDGSWDGATRRFAVNARLFDDFDADNAAVEVIDGRHLW